MAVKKRATPLLAVSSCPHFVIFFLSYDAHVGLVHMYARAHDFFRRRLVKKLKYINRTWLLVKLWNVHYREMLIQAVDTCLSSKVVSQNCETISPMAVDAVLGIIDAASATNVDLRDIKVNKILPFRGIQSNWVKVRGKYFWISSTG